MNIAVILTCHNRREKTLRCLDCLFKAWQAYSGRNLQLAVYLTDDGCSDGTAEAVLTRFSNQEIHIVKGDGNCFWAGGMRLAWREALREKERWDDYLLVNDDTFANETLFKELDETHAYCLAHYGRSGLYSCVTSDTERPNHVTYGGCREDWMKRLHPVFPNGVPQMVDFANANALLVPAGIVDELGIFCDGFRHGNADFDYTRQARRHHIPVLITAHVCASCDNDHGTRRVEASKLYEMTLSERRKFLNHPLHCDADYLLFVRHNMPIRYPITWTLRKMRLYFPHLYYAIIRWRGLK
jgi:GT2 family glycosyltransferase